MIDFPNAKINLGLNILSKRKDGFHNLETVFYPIQLSDILEINVAEEFSFMQTGLIIEGNQEQNLVVKAYRLLQNDFQLEPVRIHLHKIVPFGAGLGGGSSDAAFSIKMLNSIFQLNLSIEKMQEYACRLGSDCSFFIVNKPSLAKGRGEILSDIPISLSGYCLVLVNPGIHVPTVEAYARVTPKVPLVGLTELTNQKPDTWFNTLKNDFEDSIFERHPEIENLRNNMYHMGAVYASMSGSGSSVFGIFSDPLEKLPVEFDKYFVWQEILV